MSFTWSSGTEVASKCFNCSHLHVDGPMKSVAQGREGVSARGWIEIRASCNGVLPGVRRSAVTSGQIVMLEVIVPLQFNGR